MTFSEINPYVRFARYMTIENTMSFPSYIPLDVRLFLCIDGQGSITVKGQSYPMKKGCLLLVNTGVEYILNIPENSVSYIVFNFDFTQRCKHMNFLVRPVEPSNFDPIDLVDPVTFADVPQFNSCQYLKHMDTLEKPARRLVREYETRQIGNDLMISCLMTQLLVEILRVANLSSGDSSATVQNILDYIHANYNKPLSNRSVAEEFGFHPNYISRLVKKSTGLPLHQYQLQTRLMKAIKLLDLGACSIGEIAEQCGFCDIYYFSKYFKSVMKVTPSQFIKHHNFEK